MVLGDSIIQREGFRGYIYYWEKVSRDTIIHGKVSRETIIQGERFIYRGYI